MLKVSICTAILNSKLKREQLFLSVDKDIIVISKKDCLQMKCNVNWRKIKLDVTVRGHVSQTRIATPELLGQTFVSRNCTISAEGEQG